MSGVWQALDSLFIFILWCCFLMIINYSRLRLRRRLQVQVLIFLNLPKIFLWMLTRCGNKLFTPDSEDWPQHQCSGKQEKEVLVVALYCQTWIAGLLETVIEILKCENISCAAERLTDGRSPQAPAGHSGHTRSAAQRWQQQHQLEIKLNWIAFKWTKYF